MFEALVGEAPFYKNGGEAKLFERIIRAKVVFPSDVPKVAVHLISRLLEKVCVCPLLLFTVAVVNLRAYQDLSKRLGCLKNGIDDVKKHRFFQGVDWIQLQSSKFVAGGSLKPTLKSDGDMSRFEANKGLAHFGTDDSFSGPIPRAQQKQFAGWS